MTEDKFLLQRRGSDEEGDRVFEKLINRFWLAGWIDAVAELPAAVQLHFTELGKQRFRALHEIVHELELDLDRLDKEERAQLPEIVEAWFPAVERQRD
jgi:hypothetical protein